MLKLNECYFMLFYNLMFIFFRAGTVWVNCYDALHSQAPFGGYKVSCCIDLKNLV